MPAKRLPLAAVLCLAFTACWLMAAGGTAARIDFAKEVYPVLQRSCFECHGPDHQKGGLRLDQREAALKADSGKVISPGKPEASELLRRISLPESHEDRMPKRGEHLKSAEIERIRAWIQQGADWPDGLKPARHWAYIAPVRPQSPLTAEPDWVKNPIDEFILSRLRIEGIKPSPAADPAVLLRRVYLDLIGLPPTPAQVDAFLADKSSDAYEKIVDQLLASPQFGERWARPWLDLARYADSHGFQRDDLREIWPYRDWVIRALNADMPFDQFTLEQIAGDLLPNATESQKIATGFNRCTTTNVEAGTEPEETRVNQIFDRINTVGATWLGSTLECAQCHDHKYDPFTMRDYYSLFAFFNNTALEADRTKANVPGSIQFMGPEMKITEPGSQSERSHFQQELAKLDQAIAARKQEMASHLDKIESQLKAELDRVPRTSVFKPVDVDSAEGSTHQILEDQSVLFSGETPDTDIYTIQTRTDLTGITAIRLEALTHPSLPGEGPGRGAADRPNFVLNEFSATIAPADGSSPPVAVIFTDATADFSQKSFSPALTINGNTKGWAIMPQFHKPHWAQYIAEKPLGYPGGSILTFKLDQHFGQGRIIGRVRLSAVTGAAGVKPLPEEVAAILRTDSAKRTAEQKTKLLEFCYEQDSQMDKLADERAEMDRKIRAVKAISTLVMVEMEKPRASAIFTRGNYTTRGAAVQPASPAPGVLHSLPDGAPGNRIGLARWLTDTRNPLTARVVVNRWWAELFGRGIVSTVEDFGIKGEPPTHPELLDWLAVEFMQPTPGTPGSDSARPWSMKHMLKLMVTSATYRQSSKLTEELRNKDDQNRLLARGPRFRLDAELIRDNALAAAGLLSLQQFGPPIYPPQPDGLWTKVGGQKYDYKISPGSEKNRRGIYVVLKRGSPYPSFVNFDASARLACTVKRSRSNTPLQALTLLNDPVYVEAAMALARRIIEETSAPGITVDERLIHGFRICLARKPGGAELAALRSLYEAQYQHSVGDPAGVKELLEGVAVPPGIDPARFAAWHSVATALLNLDEMITKG